MALRPDPSPMGQGDGPPRAGDARPASLRALGGFRGAFDVAVAVSTKTSQGLPESIGFLAGVDDVRPVGQSVQNRPAKPSIGKHRGPFATGLPGVHLSHRSFK